MADKKQQTGNYGIIVSGGPAPGINSVIAAVVLRARSLGHQVFGFQRGFLGVVERGNEAVTELTWDVVRPIANTGGSILGTSRYNPFAEKDGEKKLLAAFTAHNIDKLVVIGGEGSAHLSSELAKHAPELRIAHIPKTIDNDLILPNNYPSFGFETARYAGTRILNTLINEAKTTNRWFIVRTMGRKAGFLALGLGLTAGANLTLIAEEFPDQGVTLEEVAQRVYNSVKKRAQEGKFYGTAVVAEGIIDKLDTAELADCPRDDMGRIRFAEVDLEDLIARRLRRIAEKDGLKIRVSSENIGYELRCREPVPFDIEYTRLLGYGAVRYLTEGLRGIMIVRDFDKLAYVKFEDMRDADGKIQSRKVELDSDVYKVACSFMTR